MLLTQTLERLKIFHPKFDALNNLSPELKSVKHFIHPVGFIKMQISGFIPDLVSQMSVRGGPGICISFSSQVLYIPSEDGDLTHFSGFFASERAF